MTSSCSVDLLQRCALCEELPLRNESTYDCSLPGLEGFAPGQYEGLTANYLSFVTNTSSPSMPIRAREFEACTGGRIIFSEAANVWEDPVFDLGTKTSRGSELYDGYFMSNSHFPEVASLGLAEHLNDRIRKDNDKLKWEDMLPKVRTMGEYRRDGATNIDFLMFDGDFFVPIVRLDLLENHEIPLPNTWDELVDIAKFFNGTDLNDDGIEDDYGFCHFPRQGAGSWDWWWAEEIYSTWATTDQTDGIHQGFMFDEETMEPRIGEGFRYASGIWKDLWKRGANPCDGNFHTGRCAVGFTPPGCWKSIFLNGVNRKDSNGTVIWKPTMKSGEYAEPYRFKPFGSTKVVDRETGQFTQCTKNNCPLSERIPAKGHHGDDDRASVLPPSPLEGQLINRAPFYWSGGLGTLIRKSAPEVKKDLLWHFFVYANSEHAAVYDVSHYSSWLDSWRYSQLASASSFVDAGWSLQSYQEHVSVMSWALSNDANGAFNIRIPGVVQYTRDVVGGAMNKYIIDEIDEQTLMEDVHQGWSDVTTTKGKLNQLEIYRASLSLEDHTEVQLCQLHRPLMDNKDPSVCRVYDPETSENLIVRVSLLGAIILAVVGLTFAVVERRRKSRDDSAWKIDPSEVTFANPPEVLGKGTFGTVFAATYHGSKVAVKSMYSPSEDVSASMFDTAVSTDVESQVPDQDTSSMAKMSAKAWADFEKVKPKLIEVVGRFSKLRHPCVATIMGTIIEQNVEPMLVTEYMDLGSLYDVLRNHTLVIDGDVVLSVLRDIAQGLRFLHAADPTLIHGDLKSRNVLVDARFRAKLCDFGLTEGAINGARGSPCWMAPEVLRGESGNSAASDVYSFGIIMNEIYSRKDPYEGEETHIVVKKIMDPLLHKRPAVPTTCPSKMVALMGECVAEDPKSRPTSEELDLQLKRLNSSSVEPIGLRKPVDLTEELLYDVFPEHVAKALREGRDVEPESKEVVTILFSDIVNFTKISSAMAPMEVFDLLNRLYRKFDQLSREFDIFKVETIGDAYMAVTNLVKDQEDTHAQLMVDFASRLIQAANETLLDLKNPSKGYVNIRVGIHSGPVVATVVGHRNRRYCLFGDVSTI